MARTAKRYLNRQKLEYSQIPVYKTAIYARLSVDHEDKKAESTETQVEMLKEFIQHQNGNYLEKIFLFMKVRFISVCDHYDSFSKDADSQELSMNIKNLVNNAYAKDIRQNPVHPDELPKRMEVLWLLNQLYILMLKKEKAFVIIEEPEAHLYPNLQNRIVEFIAYFANINSSSIMITTHSPYILTSVNTLYCAGKTI